MWESSFIAYSEVPALFIPFFFFKNLFICLHLSYVLLVASREIFLRVHGLSSCGSRVLEHRAQ